MTIGDRIKQLRDKESRKSLADKLGVGQMTIVRYENNERLPDADFIVKFCDLFNITTDWLIYGRNSKELPSSISQPEIADEYVKVPRVATELAAGPGSFLDSVEVIEELAFRREWLAHKGQLKDLVIMTIWGDSMEPTLHDKDVALINLAQTKPHTGHVYAVGHDEAVYIKRLVVEPGRLIMRSDNRDYSDIILAYDNQPLMDKVKIIGRAVWWCHDEKN